MPQAVRRENSGNSPLFTDNLIMKPNAMRGKKLKLCALGIFLLGVSGWLGAAPLEGGYALAPAAAATTEQKDAAYREARFRVIAAAGKYENTPYRYGGVDARGMDCSGLVYTSFKDALSVVIPRTAATIYAWTEKISADKLLPGDLVFFKTDRSGEITHVGIFVGGGRFIHAASEGPNTGVIYSGLSESYWARTYAGSGRVLPPADIYANVMPLPDGEEFAEDGVIISSGGGVKTEKSLPGKPAEAMTASDKKEYALIGGAIAPSWKGFLADGKVVRGIAGQLRLGVAANVFKLPLVFSVELRPEWDGALGVFRLPITFSLGYKDKFSIFAGPAFSFGDATLQTSGGERRYTSGSPWFGTVGISAAPFAIPISRGELAPYAEFAWQSYFSDNDSVNLNADLCAGFRLSTGLRFTWKL